MKIRKLLRITVVDENRLEERFSRTFRPVALWSLLGGMALGLMILGVLLLWVTPLHTLMPGYLPRQQRIAAEEAFLRIDSMRDEMAKSREYLLSVMRAIDPERFPPEETGQRDHDSAAPAPEILPGEIAPGILADSLLKPSEQEERFALAVRRREGFNLQVLAPLAAEGMEFCFPASSGVYVRGVEGALTQGVLIPRDASIVSVADGSVVGVTRSVREHGYIIWIQHDNGFLSRYSRLGSPIVDQGSRVSVGEAIALPAVGAASGAERVDIQLWHDGERLEPRKYLP